MLAAARNYVNVGKYGYDGLGRRVESVEGTSTAFYAYKGTETLYEKLVGQANLNDYVYAAGMRIAKVSGNTVNYYHSDHLGSTRLVTDSSNNVKVLFSNSYQPFGQDNGTSTKRWLGKLVTNNDRQLGLLRRLRSLGRDTGLRTDNGTPTGSETYKFTGKPLQFLDRFVLTLSELVRRLNSPGRIA